MRRTILKVLPERFRSRALIWECVFYKNRRQIKLDTKVCLNVSQWVCKRGHVVARFIALIRYIAFSHCSVLTIKAPVGRNHPRIRILHPVRGGYVTIIKQRLTNNALRGVSLQSQALVIGYALFQMTAGKSFVKLILYFIRGL